MSSMSPRSARHRSAISSAVLLAALCTAGAATAGEPAPRTGASDDHETTLRQALEGGVLDLDLRYRLEWVDDAAFDEDALASTLRGALGYETGSFRGFSAVVTFETVTAIGNDELYNDRGADGLGNGVTDRPVVADAEIVEVDQLFLGWRGSHGLGLKAGRFGYTLDNQRFIGTAAWRQNHRSYEALAFEAGSPSTLRTRYAYFARSYFNTGASFDLDAHILHLSRSLGNVASAAAYAYLVDWHDADRSHLSSATYGLRLVGGPGDRPSGLLWFAELARQLDHGDTPRGFALDYAHLGLGVRRGAWSVQAAWELKDGDGTSAVQTPLGTNHGLNGFADRLVVTPPDGSHDLYLRIAMDRERWSWLVAYHDFRAARGGAELGTEVDLQARWSAAGSLSLWFKVAHYLADTLSTDVTKVMLWTTWSFDTSF